MATLNVKSGGQWKAVGNSKLAVKYNGAWLFPSGFQVKNGGAWSNSGYTGDPSAPTGLAVNAWATHEAVSFKWTAGAGGAPVSGFDVMMRNSTGTTATTGSLIVTKSDAASPSVDFTEVVQGTQYNVYVRSKTAAGVVSAWVGPLQIKMGKDALTTYTTEEATRTYSKAADVNGYDGAAVGPTIPTSVKVTSIHYKIKANINPNTGYGFTSALSPYNNREIRRRGNTADHEQFSWLSESVDYTLNVADYQSNGGVQGMICHGIGWASGPATHYARAVGTITVNGIETYEYQQSHVTPAVANGYW